MGFGWISVGNALDVAFIGTRLGAKYLLYRCMEPRAIVAGLRFRIPKSIKPSP